MQILLEIAKNGFSVEVIRITNRKTITGSIVIHHPSNMKGSVIRLPFSTHEVALEIAQKMIKDWNGNSEI